MAQTRKKGCTSRRSGDGRGKPNVDCPNVAQIQSGPQQPQGHSPKWTARCSMSDASITSMPMMGSPGEMPACQARISMERPQSRDWHWCGEEGEPWHSEISSQSSRRALLMEWAERDPCLRVRRGGWDDAGGVPPLSCRRA
jgi:hypothetical protein